MDVPVHGGDLQPGADAEPRYADELVGMKVRHRGTMSGDAVRADDSEQDDTDECERIDQRRSISLNRPIFPHPANYRLKLAARGRSEADALRRSRAAAYPGR